MFLVLLDKIPEKEQGGEFSDSARESVNKFFGSHDPVGKSPTYSNEAERKDALRVASNKALGVPIPDSWTSEEKVLQFSDEDKRELKREAVRQVNNWFGTR